MYESYHGPAHMHAMFRLRGRQHAFPLYLRRVYMLWATLQCRHQQDRKRHVVKRERPHTPCLYGATGSAPKSAYAHKVVPLQLTSCTHTSTLSETVLISEVNQLLSRRRRSHCLQHILLSNCAEATALSAAATLTMIVANQTGQSAAQTNSARHPSHIHALVQS